MENLDKMVLDIRKRFKNGETVVLLAECKVHYRGRSRSELGLGGRVIILKNDGATIIHRPFGCDPVNWQPPGSQINFLVKDGVFKIRVVRPKPYEILEIEILRLIGVVSGRLIDEALFIEEGSEEDMKRAILFKPELVERKLEVIDVEKPVETGVIDILARDSEGRIVVIELKKDTAGTEAVIQLKRYVEAIRRDFGEARGILVAPGISKKAYAALTGLGLEYVRLSVDKCLKVLEKYRKEGLTAFM